MQNNEILLSIIIPTKNRYSTLLIVLDSILDNFNKKFEYEIVIQDNSDNNNECIEYLQLKNDIHLKYFYNDHSLPVSDNTELAINNAKGKYLLFIGDDDFISPNVDGIIELMIDKSVKALIYNPGHYWWDSIIFKNSNYYNKPMNLWIPNIDYFLELKILNPKNELKKILNKGAMAYDMLPRLYHGIVLRSEIEKLKTRIGSYIVGSCPDIDFAVSLAINLNEYYFINYPVTVFGASKNSGGGWTALKTHYGSIDKLPFLRPEIKDKWNPLIPRIWSERTIYPQTTSEVLKKYDLADKVNLLPLYAAMLIYEPFLEPRLFKYIFKYCQYNPFKYLIFFKEILKKFAGLIVQKWKIKFQMMPFEVIENVQANVVGKILKKREIRKDL
jgi:glycosyltransferase involved in cell wall biosynthesis